MVELAGCPAGKSAKAPPHTGRAPPWSACPTQGRRAAPTLAHVILTYLPVPSAACTARVRVLVLRGGLRHGMGPCTHHSSSLKEHPVPLMEWKYVWNIYRVATNTHMALFCVCHLFFYTHTHRPATTRIGERHGSAAASMHGVSLYLYLAAVVPSPAGRIQSHHHSRVSGNSRSSQNHMFCWVGKV